MKTRITETFGIKYPILLSGMSWISVPKMVAAVSNAGGLGILATGPLNARQTRQAIKEIKSMTDKPFGANATLMFPGAVENARVLLEEQVPVINFALGKGDWIVKEAHGYGGKVIATVVSNKHANRAQEYGCDAVIATGHEAAAHGDSLTSLIMIPTLADILKIPVIAAGGFADGRGLAAALILGAEAIAMGTRFMTTKESPLHFNYKCFSIEKDAGSTIFSDRFDGLPCRILDNEAARRAIKRGFDPISAIFNSREIARQLEMPYWEVFKNTIASGWTKARQMGFMANGFHSIRKATIDGDKDNGVLPVGQVTGLIHDEPSVGELIERMITEAKEVHDKMAGIWCL